MSELEQISGLQNIDVVVLNWCWGDLLLLYEVFSHGVPVYVRDRERYLRDKFIVVDLYLDYSHHLHQYWRALVERICGETRSPP